MSINELIARGTNPIQVESPVNQLAKVLQMQGMQQNLAKGEMEQDQYRTTKARGNRLIELNRELGNADDDQRIMAYKKEGYLSEADALQKAALERRKIGSTADKDDMETTLKHVASWRDVLGTATNPQQAAQFIQLMHSDPRMAKTPIAQVPLEQALAQVGTTPESFDMWKKNASLGATKFIEANKPTYQTQNLGGTSQTLALPGLGGPAVVANSAPITQSADNAATQATSRANNAATVGASYANAAATREIAKATRDSANAQRDQSTEMKLADDYRAQSKEFGQATSAFKQINATLDSATTSPAATLAAATKFMKILDPGSVVRESELGMALQASGVIDRATNYINILQRGKVLTPTQAADFKNISNQMYGAAQQVQQSIDADYKAKAKTYNLRPEMVVQDLGQNAKIEKGPSGIPADIQSLLDKHGGR